jgi:hypothetical protein
LTAQKLRRDDASKGGEKVRRDIDKRVETSRKEEA